MPGHIKTTHVGSLPRPADLLPYIRGDQPPPDNYDDLLGDATQAVFKHQTDVGIDVINDGELARRDYVSSARKRMTGFDAEKDAWTASDLDEMNLTEAEEKNAACSGPITYTVQGLTDLNKEIKRVVTAANANNIPLDQVFFSAPSPGTLAVFFEDDYFHDHTQYVTALGQAMKTEYEAVHAAGLLLQVDCPDLAMGRHSRFKSKTIAEFQDIVEVNIKVMNEALLNIPADRIRMHVCWGNYPGPHHHDVPLADIVHLVLSAKPKYLSIEACNPGHGHEWEVFKTAKLPEGKVLMPGVLDTTTSHIEHPRLVAQRLLNYIRLVGVDSVMASTDCGFDSAAGASNIPTEIVYAKLQAMVNGARIALEIAQEEGL